MDGKPLLHRLKFSPSIWGIILGGIYIAALWFSGGLYPKPAYGTLLTHIVLFFVLRVWWYFFFAQFILPVRKFKDRIKIYQRLIKKREGAALFIKNGKLIEAERESKKSGAGVIVLDSASAVVLKKTNQYTKTAGPGVLFTDDGETIAGIPVPLQKLKDTAGPKGDENPFAKKNPDDDIEHYTATQRRRYETSGWTRDAVEIVPNITVIFKIDADPAKGNQDGSRFGYAENAVRKAIWHTSVDQKSNKHIYWNQLPINLAADLWREYLAKYRFEELFKNDQEIKKTENPPQTKEPVPPPPAPPHYEYGWASILCDLLSNINRTLSKKIKEVEDRISPPIQDEEKSIDEPVTVVKKEPPTTETALQSITRFMAQRLKESSYNPVDRYGKVIEGAERKNCPEFHFLKERGIRILGVSVNNLRFNEELEKEMLNNWSSTWLNNAKDEKAYIEKQTQIRKTRGKEKALIEYTIALSKELAKETPKNKEYALKLLLRTTRREIIRDANLHKDAEDVIEQLTDLLHWVDKGGAPLG